VARGVRFVQHVALTDVNSDMPVPRPTNGRWPVNDITDTPIRMLYVFRELFRLAYGIGPAEDIRAESTSAPALLAIAQRRAQQLDRAVDLPEAAAHAVPFAPAPPCPLPGVGRLVI
jgi:hypothetical protein